MLGLLVSVSNSVTVISCNVIKAAAFIQRVEGHQSLKTECVLILTCIGLTLQVVLFFYAVDFPLKNCVIKMDGFSNKTYSINPVWLRVLLTTEPFVIAIEGAIATHRFHLPLFKTIETKDKR